MLHSVFAPVQIPGPEVRCYFRFDTIYEDLEEVRAVETSQWKELKTWLSETSPGKLIQYVLLLEACDHYKIDKALIGEGAAPRSPPGLKNSQRHKHRWMLACKYWSVPWLARLMSSGKEVLSLAVYNGVIKKTELLPSLMMMLSQQTAQMPLSHDVVIHQIMATGNIPDDWPKDHQKGNRNCTIQQFANRWKSELPGDKRLNLRRAGWMRLRMLPYYSYLHPDVLKRLLHTVIGPKGDPMRLRFPTGSNYTMPLDPSARSELQSWISEAVRTHVG
jgi:hypothetical protein